MTPFVGVERESLVDALVAQFEHCRDNAISCWVSIEGAAGGGKTRLVHEAFARLAGGQGNRHYWPPRLETDVADSGTELRKRVTPHWHGSPGHVPSWFWWGLRALSVDGDAISTIARDMEQFAEHEAPLEEAWRRRASVGGRMLKALPGSTVATLEEASVEVLSRTAGTVATLVTEGVMDSVPGVGATVRAVRATMELRRKLVERHEKVGSGVPISGEPFTDPVDATVALVQRLSFDGTMPVIVFVEDLHEADTLLVEMLVRLLRLERCAVLIVTTAWSGYLESETRFAPLVKARRDPALSRRSLWIGEGTAPMPATNVLGELEPLSLSDLETVTGHIIPGIAHPAARMLAERYRRPLLLERVAADPELVTLFGPELNRLTPEAVAELPVDLDAYLRRAFERLPSEQQQQLRAAASSLPHRIDAASSPAALDWRADFVLPALDSVAGTDHAGYPMSHTLDGWIISSDWPLCWFREWGELECVASHPLRAELVARLRATLAQKLVKFFADVPHGAETDHHERLTLALAAADVLVDNGTIRAATERRLFRLAHLPREHAEAIRLGAVYFEHLEGHDTLTTMAVRNNLALIHAERGEIGMAIDQQKALVKDQRRALGPLHLDYLRALVNLGCMLLSAGRAGESYPVLREALTGHKSTMGTTSAETLNVRVRFVLCLAFLGRTGQARDAFDSLLPTMIQTLGADHRLVIVARAEYLATRQSQEPVANLVDEYEALAVDAADALGPEHEYTLSIRHNQATALGAAGHTERAQELLFELYKVRCHTLGPFHPNTLQSYLNVVSFVAEIGHFDQALKMGADLLTVQIRVLDREHPNVLTMRQNMGTWISQTGRPLEGVVEIHEVARLRKALFGPMSPETLRSEALVGGALIFAGYDDSGRAQLLEAIDRMRSVMQVDHPHLIEALDWLEQ